MHDSQAATLFIENWSTHPVTVSELTLPETQKGKVINAKIDIQPGQNMPVRVSVNDETYTNFNRITINFMDNEYSRTETVFFPDEATEETSLSFSDAGYKRVPFNILIKR
jgi:hypothetical protein